MQLVRSCYALTSHLPRQEQYEIGRQIRRAATSIPANIAEGFAGRPRRDLARFLTIAFGSRLELETHLDIVSMLGFVSEQQLSECRKLCEEVGKMLFAFRKAVLRRAADRKD